MRKYHIFAFCLVAWILGGVAASAGEAKVDDWIQISDRDGIKVFERQTENSKFLSLRGEGLVNAPLSRVASVFFDPIRAKEWVEDLEETRILGWTSDSEFLEYDHIGTPIIVKDRDFLSHVTLTFDRAQKQLTFEYKTATEEETPPELRQVRRVIRGELNGTKYILTSVENDTKTYILGEINSDPKGSIPRWIINMFQRDWPYRSMMALRRQVAKPDIEEIPKIANLIKLNLGLPAATAEAKTDSSPLNH